MIIIVIVQQGNWKLYVTLPADYPTSKPEVYVRSESLDRSQQSNFNKILSNFVIDQADNEPCIYVLISWVQDNVEKYLKTYNNNNKKRGKPPNKKVSKDSRFARYWIYSHHIYSKIKRKEIIDVAKENNITGFCLSGKPGIICGEGDSEECEDWWQRVSCFLALAVHTKILFGHLISLIFTDKIDELAEDINPISRRRASGGQ